MSCTDRRRFLASTLSVAGAAAAPPWLGGDAPPAAAAAAQQAILERERWRELRAAVQKAQDQGKPLFVFVIPEDRAGREARSRGMWLGATWNHGLVTGNLMANTCVPICATVDDVRRLTGAEPGIADPLAMVVDVSRVGTGDALRPRVEVVPFDAGLRETAAGWRDIHSRDPDAQREWIRTSILVMGSVCLQAVSSYGRPDDLAPVVRTKATQEQLAAFDSWQDTDPILPPEDILVLFAAAIAHERIYHEPANRKRAGRLASGLEAALHRQARTRTMPGSRWVVSRDGRATIERLPGEPAASPAVEWAAEPALPWCERVFEFWTHPGAPPSLRETLRNAFRGSAS